MSHKSVELEKLATGDEASIGRAGYYKDAEYIDEQAYGYGSPEGEGLQLGNVWRAVRKRKWLITAITALVTLFVTVEVHRPKPIYEASATVEVKKDTWVMIKSGDTLLEEEADTGLSLPTIKTNTLLLKSRPLLQDVVTRLQLTREPTFFDITRRKKSLLETLRSLSPIAGAREQIDAQGSTPYRKPDEVEIAEIDEPTENPEQESEMSEEERKILSSYVRVLQDNLNVDPVKDTRVLRVSFTHTDPNIAAAVANAVAESFIEHRFLNTTTRLNRATAWLVRTTRDLKAKIEKAEFTLASYSREHNIYAPDAKATLTSDKLTKLHSEALRAETERVLKESLYEEVKAGRIAELPEAFADPRSAALQVQQSELAIQEAQLSVSFGPKNPQVAEIRQKRAAIQAQIDASRTALERKLNAEYARAARDERTLKTALEEAKSEAVEDNQYAIQYSLLKQEADTARSLYTQFLQKTNQANIQLAEQPRNARLIEPADVPSYPLTPNRPLYILLAFLMSFVACAGAAFAFERLNKNIKSMEDVTRYVQLPAIGVIPEIKAHSSRHFLARNGKKGTNGRLGEASILRPAKFSPVVSMDDRSVAAEAYRAVSTSVLLAPHDSPPKTILVTSGLPGEGKTTTVINTAISLAQFGASVLIIDCDLRNPTTHKVFNLDSGRGLSTYLSSDVAIDDLVRKLEIPNLHLLPAGPIPQNPAKLIISPKMKALLKSLGERYDHILIDSPPLVGVTDPIILSTLVDGVIVVVHGTKSTRERVRRTRHELTIVGAHIFGVVLNNINFTDYQYYEPDYKYIGSSAEDT